jgi:hypothetical protein
VVLDRLKFTQQSHLCHSLVPLRMRSLLLSYLFTKRVIKLSVVIIQAYHRSTSCKIVSNILLSRLINMQMQVDFKVIGH